MLVHVCVAFQNVIDRLQHGHCSLRRRTRRLFSLHKVNCRTNESPKQNLKKLFHSNLSDVITCCKRTYSVNSLVGVRTRAVTRYCPAAEPVGREPAHEGWLENG